MSKTIRYGLVAALAVGAMAGAAQARPQVSGSWVRLAAVPGNPAAGYFVLRGDKAAHRLTAVSSPMAARIELHESGMAGHGMMTMRPLKDVVLPAGGTVRFAPGGNHAMIFGIKPAIKAGGTMPLRLVFADGQVVEAAAKVIAAGDSPPAP